MPTLTVLKQDGSSQGEITLNENIFGLTPNESLIFDAIQAQRAAARQGTHKVKNRSEVRGGGRKPWRQKGTGRARHGSTRSPIWRGGGVVFGPTTNRAYNKKMNRKERRLAIKSILSAKVLDEEMIVVNDLALDAPKTKELQEVLNGLGANGRALIVVDELDDNLVLSARNLKGVRVVTANEISVIDVIYHDHLVMTEDALAQVEEALA